MALTLKGPEEEAEFVLHVRQNMVRVNLPAIVPLSLRRQRGLPLPEGVDIGAPVLPPVITTAPTRGSLDQCLGEAGFPITMQTTLAGAAVQGGGSLSIPGPFLINHILMYTSTALTDRDRFRFKLASDNDTTGGEATSGTFITSRFSPENLFIVGTDPIQIFPTLRSDLNPGFIKVIFERVVAGNSDLSVHIGILLL